MALAVGDAHSGSEFVFPTSEEAGHPSDTPVAVGRSNLEVNMRAEPGERSTVGGCDELDPQRWRLPRRRLFKMLGGMGIGSAVFGRALISLADETDGVTPEMIRQAEWIAGLGLTDEQREMVARGVNRRVAQFEKLRRVPVDNSVPPALSFFPTPPQPAEPAPPRRPVGMTESASADRPAREVDLAFAPVTELAPLLRSRRVSSLQLNRLYLDRLRQFDPQLHCVITYTQELALRQAERADREIAAGRYRGPLHGIPWGAKDLLAVPGYRTTWGAKPYEHQKRQETATVAARLERAGAVLVAKLTLGALAMGDVWFGETTRNPWKPEQGSSGSSAGSASSTAAGLVGFAIGSETWGSIVSPSTRCGVTGLRPTFGRVSRHGAMALAWSMDKLGPITRSVEDCALIFHAIHGPDGLDPTVVDKPFHWPPTRDVRTLRVGFVEGLFAAPDEPDNDNDQENRRRARRREQNAFDRQTLETLRGLGIELIPIKLPDSVPVRELSLILTAEAATAFDELTRSGRDKLLVRQTAGAWPDTFRQGQLIPAVEYLRANRIRTMLMREMERRMADLDVYVCPTFGGNNSLMTNLTGHPAVVVPNGFRAEDGTPTSITFIGSLYGETDLLAVAHAYQQATDFHLRRPPVGGQSTADRNGA